MGWDQIFFGDQVTDIAMDQRDRTGDKWMISGIIFGSRDAFFVFSVAESGPKTGRLSTRLHHLGRACEGQQPVMGQSNNYYINTDYTIRVYMGVSINGGTTKSSIQKDGFSMIFHDVP